MNFRLSILVLSLFTLLLFPPYFSLAATATHSYDELNRLTQTVYDTGSKITTIDYTYDPAGNMLNYTINANFLLGDVDDSKTVGLTDVILCLQLLSGGQPTSTVHRAADIDGDDKISSADLIFVLREVADL